VGIEEGRRGRPEVVAADDSRDLVEILDAQPGVDLGKEGGQGVLVLST